MQEFWLTKRDRGSCIIFFAGWGMDPTPFQDMPVHEHDLLMVYDYSEMGSWEFKEHLSSYDRLHLVAWSMGVWAAAFVCAGQEGFFTTATAVNGTLAPIDDDLGIDRRAFADMTATFSTPVLHDFYANMFTEPDEAKRFFRHRPKRSKENILHELVQLGKYCGRMDRPAADIYRRRIVGSRDRIFPARNQVRSWGRDQCVIIRAPHFPFYGWSSWDLIVSDEIV